jgi:hypothetical protein
LKKIRVSDASSASTSSGGEVNGRSNIVFTRNVRYNMSNRYPQTRLPHRLN